MKENFKDRLKQAIKIRETTQTELSIKTGIPKSAISQYLSGKFMAKQDRVSILAKALSVSDAWLMGFDVTMERLNYSPELTPVEMPEILKKRLPLIGNIAAGTPIEAIQEVDEYVNIETEIDCDCCLRVCGNSMIDAGIHNGDIALIKYQETLLNGQIGAIILDNEVTLKKFYKYDNTLVLRPCNEEYQDMVFTEENHPDSIRIFGKCVGVVHKI